MNKINIWPVLLFIVLLQACSFQDIYNYIHGTQLLDCQTVPRSQYDECVERNNDSYDEYLTLT